jgi:hypothetical protein
LPSVLIRLTLEKTNDTFNDFVLSGAVRFSWKQAF